MGWQGQRLGISVCRVGILWDYLRMCSCGNGMAGLAFGCFFCVRLDFVGAMSGRVIRKLGGKDREMGLSR